MRQLIRTILKEETEQDLSPVIKKLLESSIVSTYEEIICNIDVVAPWKRGPIGTHSDFKDYQIRVNVIGGLGSKRWPQTQSVYKERDKIVNDVWHTVYNFMGLSTDVFLRNVKSCDEVTPREFNEEEQNEGELTERCWKGYTQKGMKTMFGKRYPNCVKKK